MKNYFNVFAIVLCIILFIGFAIGGWYFKRIINYNLLYKDCVKETIKEMVKAEALK